MIYVGLAFVAALISSVPLFLARRPLAGGLMFAACWLVLGLVFYGGPVSFVGPFFGGMGVAILLGWCVASFISCAPSDDYDDFKFRHTAWFGIAAVALFLGRGCGSCGAFRAEEYAGMIGQVEERVWTQDVQPKDPKHVRLVPPEMALWLADKQLGEAPGAIGSQFQVSAEHLTLQAIKGELWYAVPLDFKDFGTWSSADASPGYVLVNAEDPLQPVIVKTGERFLYTPAAYFGHYLERHLLLNGYLGKGLRDFTFEIDEEGKAWWTATVYEPTICWSGEKVLGVVLVNPTDGSSQFHALGAVPKWVDRVVPQSIVKDYISWRGGYAQGWWNSVWAENNVTQPGTPTIVYGADNEPYWVTDVTSSNQKDESIVGLMYTDSRTGKSVFYRAVGGTEDAVLTAVNNKVSYRKLHGSSPVIYNIYGTMSSIVPLLGENHTYQGVAIVRVDNMQVAVGDSQQAALREYQQLISQSGQQIAPELTNAKRVLTGRVDRFAAEIKEKETLYYLHLDGVRKLFTGNSGLSSKLPLTRPGDVVSITFIDSGEDVEPLLVFDNKSLPLDKTPAQQQVEDRAAGRRSPPAEADQ